MVESGRHATWRWRCPATRSRSAGWPAPGSRSGRSPTSRRTTSTSTPTWRTTSRPRPRLFDGRAGAPRWSASTTRGGSRLAARVPGAVTVGHHRATADWRAADVVADAGRHAALHRARPGRARAAGPAAAARRRSTSPTRWSRWPAWHAAGHDPAVARRAGSPRSRCPAGCSASTPASRSSPSSTTRTSPPPSAALLDTLRAQVAERRAAHGAGLRRRPRPRQAPADGRRRARSSRRRCSWSPTTTRAPRTRPTIRAAMLAGARERARPRRGARDRRPARGDRRRRRRGAPRRRRRRRRQGPRDRPGGAAASRSSRFDDVEELERPR